MTQPYTSADAAALLREYRAGDVTLLTFLQNVANAAYERGRRETWDEIERYDGDESRNRRRRMTPTERLADETLPEKSPLPFRLRQPHSPYVDEAAAEYIERLEAERDRLNQFKLAYDIWHEKTEWVQEQRDWGVSGPRLASCRRDAWRDQPAASQARRRSRGPGAAR